MLGFGKAQYNFRLDYCQQEESFCQQNYPEIKEGGKAVPAQELPAVHCSNIEQEKATCTITVPGHSEQVLRGSQTVCDPNSLPGYVGLCFLSSLQRSRFRQPSSNQSICGANQIPYGERKCLLSVRILKQKRQRGQCIQRWWWDAQQMQASLKEPIKLSVCSITAEA